MANLASELSPTDMRLLAAAWISCETPPKPNYNIIAQICGYKNSGSASVMYGHVRRKLANAAKGLKDEGDGAETEDAAKVTPKTPTKKKRATTDAGDGPPKKRGRKAKAKNPTPEAESEAGEPEDDKKTVVKEETAEADGEEATEAGEEIIVKKEPAGVEAD